MRVEVASEPHLYTARSTGDDDTFYRGILGDPHGTLEPGTPCPTCRAGEVLVRFEADGGGESVSPLYPTEDADIDAAYGRPEDRHSRVDLLRYLPGDRRGRPPSPGELTLRRPPSRVIGIHYSPHCFAGIEEGA